MGNMVICEEYNKETCGDECTHGVPHERHPIRCTRTCTTRGNKKTKCVPCETEWDEKEN